MLGGLFYTMAGLNNLRYNPANVQDVHTSGVIVSKWNYRVKGNSIRSSTGRSTGTARPRSYYKMGIIYSLNPNHLSDPKAIAKTKKYHRKQLRRLNHHNELGRTDVDREKIRKLSEGFAKSNNINIEDVLYRTVGTHKNAKYNLYDVIRLEYVSHRPWDIKFKLTGLRKTIAKDFRIGTLLLFLGAFIYFIRSKINQFL